MKKTIIFSDFDGTITERDVILAIMEQFASADWINLKNKILYERTVTLKDGVEALFKMLDSSKKDEIVEFIKKNVKLRLGFKDFLQFCNENQIQFKVLSGGLDFHIEPILENLIDKKEIICNKANFNSKHITIDYKYLPKNCTLCGDCGCCKIEAIENYPKESFFRIIIGDSLTDLAPSKVADLVFARGDLIKYLEHEKISYIPFEDFYEVKKQLQQRLLQQI